MTVADDVCAALELDIEALLDLEIKLPGGISIKPKFDIGEMPSANITIGKLLNMLTPALTPLMPVFRILELVMAIVDFAKAIPDALGPPPDPTKIADALIKVNAKAGFVLQLVPQLSIPIMVKSIIKTIIVALQALKGTLSVIIDVQVKLDLATSLKAQLEAAVELDADGNVVLGLDGQPIKPLLGAALKMEASIACAKVNADAQLAVTGKAIQPISALLGLVTIFLEIAAIPGLPKLELNLTGGSAAAMAPVLVAIDDFIVILQTVSDSLPVP